LRGRGWDIVVNIVGFAIDDASLTAEFAAWAELGGGNYFNAADRATLAHALTMAVIGPFAVVRADGLTVAQGRPGEAIALPAGDYVIQWGTGQSTAATVPSGGTVRVMLE
jgi:hypothetical protein